MDLIQVEMGNTGQLANSPAHRGLPGAGIAGDDDFLIISNSYGDFPVLLDSLIEAVPAEVVADETRQLAKQPPLRQADVFTAWFAVIALAYVLLAQFST